MGGGGDQMSDGKKIENDRVVYAYEVERTIIIMSEYY